MAEAPMNPMARFDRAKVKAKQEVNAQTQEAKDAMARRFASMGLQNSGAAIKTEGIVQQKSNEALNNRLEGIQGQEEQEYQRLDEVKQARDFAKSEREAGQQFGAGQADIQRKFASDEAKFGRDFAMKQMQESQNFAKGERVAGQSFAQDMTDRQQQFQKDFVLGPQGEQWQKQYELAMKQFEMDAATTAFNTQMAESEANKKNIFEKAGDMGTSVWKGITSPSSWGGSFI